MANLNILWCPAADDRVITLVKGLMSLLTQCRNYLPVEPEHQDSGSASIQTINRTHASADLISQQLQCKLGVAVGNFRSVRQHLFRLGDNDKVFVLIEDFQYGHEQKVRRRKRRQRDR